MLIEQLGMYLKDLMNLESTNPIEDAQQILINLRATKEHEWTEVGEQIAEHACHLNDSRASYQNLTNDLQRSVIITKNAEDVISSV